MDINLTTGSVATLMKGGTVEKPVFQILGFKKIAREGGSERFRLNISDGLHNHTMVMLAVQLNYMIREGLMDNFCVIRAEKIDSNAVADKRFITILDLTVLEKGVKVARKLGNPMQFVEENAYAGGVGVSSVVQSSPPPQADTNLAVKSESATTPKSTTLEVKLPCATVPIRDITSYGNFSKSSMRARVTSKSSIRTWSNSNGNGKLFNIDLLDDSGEIRMTGFNTAVDQFYNLLEINEVYTISNFSAKPANKQFNTLDHDYEIIFVNDTSIVPCLGADAANFPTLSFNFLEIALIGNCENNQMIDVVAVCKSRGELQTVIAQTTNKELKKRDIILVDRSKTEIVLTLWDTLAENFKDDSKPVIALKRVRVTDFNGKRLSLSDSSVMMINPDISEARDLRGWYDQEGITIATKRLVHQRGVAAGANAPWIMLREASIVDPSSADSGYYFKSKVTVLAIHRENMFYTACPEVRCNKKVTKCNNGMWRCEKCSKEYTDFKWRLILRVCFGDGSDSIWGTCFQEQGELVLDKNCDVIEFVQDNHYVFDAIIKEALFKSYTAIFHAKMEVYNNEQKLQYSVVELNPINYREYAQKLLVQIKENAA